MQEIRRDSPSPRDEPTGLVMRHFSRGALTSRCLRAEDDAGSRGQVAGGGLGLDYFVPKPLLWELVSCPPLSCLRLCGCPLNLCADLESSPRETHAVCRAISLTKCTFHGPVSAESCCAQLPGSGLGRLQSRGVNMKRWEIKMPVKTEFAKGFPVNTRGPGSSVAHTCT